MRPKSLGSCKDERSGLWSQPSLSSVGAPLNRGSGYTVTEFSKLDSVHKPNRGRVRELVCKKRVRRWSQRMRAQSLGGWPPLRVVTSRGRAIGAPVSLISMAFPPIYNTREMANHVRGSFVWRWRSASRPPRPFSEDFYALCPRFSLSEAEGAAANFELPEIVQPAFYNMLLNEAVELGVAYDFTIEGLKSALVGLRWSTFEVWMGCVDHVLRAAQLQRLADEVEVRGPLDD
ncbi:hypothetical protein Cgig2_004705 [Carnegiea gigantea]|uniref:Uncharacterized protein n=1 Tax=Carnegiea gigantea TaxID=171969 RepID=A0A9Q1Q790_9CARY|nr:hypothetical protein Cgig2_004705 [Carnegiea gigantea]